MRSVLFAFLTMAILMILGISFWVFTKKIKEHTCESKQLLQLEQKVYQVSDVLSKRVLTQDLVQQLKKLNDPSYLIIVKYNGHVMVHGLHNSFNSNTNSDNLVNADIIQEMIQKAKTGGGYVEYEWIHPITKKKYFKRTFVQPVVGKNLLVACGILRKFKPILDENENNSNMKLSALNKT